MVETGVCDCGSPAGLSIGMGQVSHADRSVNWVLSPAKLDGLGFGGGGGVGVGVGKEYQGYRCAYLR